MLREKWRGKIRKQILASLGVIFPCPFLIAFPQFPWPFPPITLSLNKQIVPLGKAASIEVNE